MKRYSMVRDGKVVAFAVDFGTAAVLHWSGTTKSTSVYGDMRTLRAIHGHPNTAFVEQDSEWFSRAASDAYQSRCENVPFSDIGGLGNRSRLAANDPSICPSYVPEMHRGAYLDGYRAAALDLYGSDWETCSFGWAPAMMIGGEPAKCAHEAAWMPGRTECGPCEDARGMAKLRREAGGG